MICDWSDKKCLYKTYHLKIICWNGYEIETKQIKFLGSKKWVEPYKDSNTILQTKTHNYLQRKVCKDLNNILQGKSEENVRKRETIVTARIDEQFAKIQTN